MVSKRLHRADADPEKGAVTAEILLKAARAAYDADWCAAAALLFRHSTRFKSISTANALKYAECLRSVGCLREAEQVFALVVDVPREFAGCTALRRGCLYLAQQRVGLAESAFREAIECSPDEVWPYLSLCECLQIRERFVEASNLLEQAIGVFGENDDLLYTLGRVKRSAGDYLGAANSFKRAIKSKRRNRRARAALWDMNSCLKLADTPATTHLICSRIMRSIDQALRKEAYGTVTELLGRLERIHPLKPRQMFWLARSLRNIGRYMQALKVMDEMVESSTLEYEAAINRGRVHKERREFASAEQYFRLAAEKRPASTIPWVYLGVSCAVQEKYEEAYRAYLRGLDAVGDRDELCLNLGLLKRALGEFDEARQWLVKAMELTPVYKEASQALRDVLLCIEWEERLKR